jgi:hypothetical protein
MNPFRSEQHPGSRRWAILEDDGRSAWLYLSEPGTPKPIADSWIYNRVRLIEPAQLPEFRGGPPPAAKEVASEECLLTDPDPSHMSFVWSRDGRSVAFVLGGKALGFIVDGGNPGYSRYLLKTCSWGHPWDEKLYRNVFGDAGA